MLIIPDPKPPGWSLRIPLNLVRNLLLILFLFNYLLVDIYCWYLNANCLEHSRWTMDLNGQAVKFATGDAINVFSNFFVVWWQSIVAVRHSFHLCAMSNLELMMIRLFRLTRFIKHKVCEIGKDTQNRHLGAQHVVSAVAWAINRSTECTHDLCRPLSNSCRTSNICLPRPFLCFNTLLRSLYIFFPRFFHSNLGGTFLLMRFSAPS